MTREVVLGIIGCVDLTIGVLFTVRLTLQSSRIPWLWASLVSIYVLIGLNLDTFVFAPVRDPSNYLTSNLLVAAFCFLMAFIGALVFQHRLFKK